MHTPDVSSFCWMNPCLFYFGSLVKPLPLPLRFSPGSAPRSANRLRTHAGTENSKPSKVCPNAATSGARSPHLVSRRARRLAKESRFWGRTEKQNDKIRAPAQNVPTTETKRTFVRGVSYLFLPTSALVVAPRRCVPT